MNEFRNKDALPPVAEGAVRTALLRRAAEAGPGYRGVRSPLNSESARALAAEIAILGEAVPAYLESPTKWVDRRAKLFEAGDFPDKGVSILPDDLRRLSEGFDLPVPILIEHAESPLELGFLTQVEAVGNELFGNLALSEEANALTNRSGAKSLSLGIDRAISRICEVSLVRNPRVESAKMFGAEIRFWVELEVGVPDWEMRFREMESKAAREEATRKVEALIAEGKLVPAQAEFAAALLTAGGNIEFDGDRRPVANLVSELLDRQPKFSLYSELAPERGSSSESLFLPEELEFYRKHFPDVSLDVIAARKRG